MTPGGQLRPPPHQAVLAVRPPAHRRSPVCPAVAHECVHFRRTLWRALHPFTLLDEGIDLGALHLLLKPEPHAHVSDQGSSPPPTQQPITSAHACLVRLLAVREGLPHGDPIAPDITAAGELAEVDALRRIPLEWPLSSRTGLGRRRCCQGGA